MIVRKDFIRGAGNTQQYIRGWYLFGFLPLYVIKTVKGFS